MNEGEFAVRVVARLDQDLADLPAPTVQKLQAARMSALAACDPGAQMSVSRGFAARGWFGFGLSARLLVPAMIVIASVTGLIVWQVSGHPDEELDAGLLAGELPIHAYTDPGFETWLQQSNYERSKP